MNKISSVIKIWLLCILTVLLLTGCAEQNRGSDTEEKASYSASGMTISENGQYIMNPIEEPVEEPTNLEPALEEQLSHAEILTQEKIASKNTKTKEESEQKESVQEESEQKESVQNETDKSDACSKDDPEKKKDSEDEDDDVMDEEDRRDPYTKDGKLKVDLIIFCGQSNMAGYGGDASQVPPLTEGAGGEFRAASNPNCLYTITEPFGFYENTPIMNDYYAKRGSLVTSFVNAYYAKTGIPVVAVSASKGGMASPYWASEAVCEEVNSRFTTAYQWLNKNGYYVRQKYLVFLQGENDVIENIPVDQYLTNMYVFSNSLYENGLDKFFLIRIGAKKSDPDAFLNMIRVQTELCRTNPNFVLASTVLSAYPGKDMVDEFHYTQQVLNDVGDDAGSNVGKFTNTWVEPSMYDYKFNNMYEPVRYEE